MKKDETLTETDKIKSAMWLQSFFQVRDEISPIVFGVSEAEATGKPELKLEAFSEALGKLPNILERLKATPELEGDDIKELRKIKELEEKALDVYINSCELSIEQIKHPNRFRQSTLMVKVSLATKYWEASARKAAAFLKE